MCKINSVRSKTSSFASRNFFKGAQIGCLKIGTPCRTVEKKEHIPLRKKTVIFPTIMWLLFQKSVKENSNSKAE